MPSSTSSSRRARTMDQITVLRGRRRPSRRRCGAGRPRGATRVAASAWCSTSRRTTSASYTVVLAARPTLRPHRGRLHVPWPPRRLRVVARGGLAAEVDDRDAARATRCTPGRRGPAPWLDLVLDRWRRIDVANMLAGGPGQLGEEVARGIREAVKATTSTPILGEHFYDARTRWRRRSGRGDELWLRRPSLEGPRGLGRGAT